MIPHMRDQISGLEAVRFACVQGPGASSVITETMGKREFEIFVPGFIATALTRFDGGPILGAWSFRVGHYASLILISRTHEAPAFIVIPFKYELIGIAPGLAPESGPAPMRPFGLFQLAERRPGRQVAQGRVRSLGVVVDPPCGLPPLQWSIRNVGLVTL